MCHNWGLSQETLLDFAVMLQKLWHFSGCIQMYLLYVYIPTSVAWWTAPHCYITHFGSDVPLGWISSDHRFGCLSHHFCWLNWLNHHSCVLSPVLVTSPFFSNGRHHWKYWAWTAAGNHRCHGSSCWGQKQQAKHMGITFVSIHIRVKMLLHYTYLINYNYHVNVTLVMLSGSSYQLILTLYHHVWV